jgi:hypothetical protein
MNNWIKFLRSVESEGGSLIILILLIILFAMFAFKLGFKEAESQIYFILGALVGMLKSRGTHNDGSNTESDNSLTIKKI